MELKDLNPEQLAAVKHDLGPLLVVAGAGTGKTAVITRRIAYLIGQKKAKPAQILALTFTDKAAGEMLDRLDGLVGWDAHQVNVLTFHAFGAQLLQRFGHHLGLSTRGELINDLKKVILLKRHLGDIKLSYYGQSDNLINFLQEAVRYIGALQNQDVGLEEFRKFVKSQSGAKNFHPMDAEELKDRLKLYELYEKIKRQYGVIDHHDQIAQALRLLTEKPNLAERLREQYKYVLVDEYQDTNGPQDALLRAFVPPDGNIFAVGDDDQAIYGFRGAKLGNILNFADHFKVKKPVVLNQNYRSTQSILDAAYKLIKHNDPFRLESRLGLDKHLKSPKQGEPPIFQPFLNSTDETEGVAAMLAASIGSGQAPSQMAVLATAHGPLKLLARTLQTRGLPYYLASTVNVFEQRELIQLWNLLKWVGLVAMDEDATHLLLGPWFDRDSQEVRQLVEYSRKKLTSIEQAMIELGKSNLGLGEASIKLAEWRKWSATLPVSQLAYKLVFETGMIDRWKEQAEAAPRMIRVFEDLQLFLRHLQEYENVATDHSLGAYLQDFPLPPEIEAQEVTGDLEGIALLTVHASKGLEFDSVTIINNTGDSWGDRKMVGQVSIPDELVSDDLELPPGHERRRLLYVALTRAKNNVILTAPMTQKGGRKRQLSPFMSELFDPKQLVMPDGQSASTNVEESLQSLQRYAPITMQWKSERLPFETEDGWLELSITDIEKYDRCPYEFYLEKVLKLRTPVGPQIVFGNILHQLFHDYYSSRQLGEALTLKELEHRLEESWSNQGYRSAEEAETDHAKAIGTLKQFYDREEKTDRKLRTTEEEIKFRIPEAKLVLKGRLDATFDGLDGLEIRDFKTGRARDAEKLSENAGKSLQLRTYALALQEMLGKTPDRVVLDYVVTGVEGIAKLTPKMLTNHRGKLAEIADRIRQRDFAPKAGAFHQCIAHRYWGEGEEDAADA